MEGRAPPYLRLHANLAAVGTRRSSGVRSPVKIQLCFARRRSGTHAGLLVKTKQISLFLGENSLTSVARLDHGLLTARFKRAVTQVPDSEYLAALLMRFVSTCSTRMGSALTSCKREAILTSSRIFFTYPSNWFASTFRRINRGKGRSISF